MATLDLRLFGGCEGTFAPGDVLRIPTRKSWALLSYLALHPGRAVSREQLAGLLWSERDSEQARASLRQSIYEIRSALGGELADALDANREVVTIHVDSIGVDVLRFESLLQTHIVQDLEIATSLYTGAFLERMETNEPDFDAWLAGERARLHDLACRGLERLASTQLDNATPAAAIETSRRLIRLDPLRETAHRLLMRGLTADGRRSEAVRQFAVLEGELAAELGVTPDPESIRLRDELFSDCPENSFAHREIAQSSSNDSHSPKPIRSRPFRLARHPITLSVALGILIVTAIAGLWIGYFNTPEDGPNLAADSPESVPAPDRPTIAVLPFANISDDPQQEYLTQGLTEDLITAFSKSSQLLVIARTSVATYKDNPTKVQTIGKDLGVRYVLEGSVQKMDDSLRITTQLIDAESGHHLWSERFTRKENDIFALQDDIVRRVMIELQVQLTDGEHARIASRGTTNLDAWLLRLQAVAELYKFTRESTLRTRDLLQQAHRLDPEWSRPLAGIAWSYWWEAKNGWTDDREEWIRKGVALAQRAIELDPHDTIGYMQLGNLVQLNGEHERAIALREKAVEIAPNDFQANWGLGAVLARAGEAERGVQVLRHAERLCPRPPASLVWTLSQAQLIAGHYEDAVETANRARAMAPHREPPYIQLAAANAALGRVEDAQRAAADLLRVTPNFSVSHWKTTQKGYRNQAIIDDIGRLLTRSGLPE